MNQHFTVITVLFILKTRCITFNSYIIACNLATMHVHTWGKIGGGASIGRGLLLEKIRYSRCIFCYNLFYSMGEHLHDLTYCVYHSCCFIFRDPCKKSKTISFRDNLKQSVIPDLFFIFWLWSKNVFLIPWL